MALRLLATLFAFGERVYGLSQSFSTSKWSEENTPNLVKVLRDSSFMLNSLTAQTEMLSHALEDAQQKATEQARNLKAKYENVLKNQLVEIRAIERTSASVATENEALDHEIKHLRRVATNISADNLDMMSSLRKLKEKINVALNFTGVFIVETNETLRNAPQMQVLAELGEREAVVRSTEEHKSRLDGIGSPQAALIQTESLATPLHLTPGNIVESMDVILEELTQEQRVSEDYLRKLFDEQFGKGHKRKELALADQAHLNATRHASQATLERLRVAIEHLKGTGLRLADGCRSLQLFVKHLGASKHEASPAALLQVSAALKKPPNEFSDLNIRHSKSLIDLKREFEGRLHEQDSEIRALERKNVELSQSIKLLQDDITRARQRANRIIAANDGLQTFLHVVKTNISHVQEYVRNLLNNTTVDLLQSDPKLAILVEEAEADDKRRSLDQFQSNSSFLQVSASSTKAADSLRMHHSVGGVDKANAQDDAMVGVQASFEKAWSFGLERLASLSKQQEKLKDIKAKEETLLASVQKAVVMLEKTHSTFASSYSSLLSVLDRTSSGE